MAAPTWFGRAPLHAAAISCCILPVANAKTRSLRLGKLCVSPAGFGVEARRRPPDRAGAAVIAAAEVLAEAVFATLLRAKGALV
jgi:hypothetical protein